MGETIRPKAGERMIVQIITGMGSNESFAAARARERRRLIIAGGIATTLIVLFVAAVWVLAH